MNKHIPSIDLNRAEELVLKRQQLDTRSKLIQVKIDNIDVMLSKLRLDKETLMNQLTIVSRAEMKNLRELFSLIHQDTCYTCANSNCTIKHDTFSPKCDEYDDGLPF